MADRKDIVDDEDVAQVVDEDVSLFDDSVVDLGHIWNWILNWIEMWINQSVWMIEFYWRCALWWPFDYWPLSEFDCRRGRRRRYAAGRSGLVGRRCETRRRWWKDRRRLPPSLSWRQRRLGQTSSIWSSWNLFQINSNLKKKLIIN